MGPLPPPPGLAPLSNLAINFNNDTYRDPSVDDIIAATLSSLSTSDQVTTIELIGLLYYSLQQKSMFSSERHIEVNEFIHTLSQYWPHIITEMCSDLTGTYDSATAQSLKVYKVCDIVSHYSIMFNITSESSSPEPENTDLDIGFPSPGSKTLFSLTDDVRKLMEYGPNS